MSSTAHQLQLNPSTSLLRKRTYSTEPETLEPPTKYAASIQLYQFVLESESSNSSEHDTESVHSIQDKETDFARDTSDTDYTDSDVEYDVASLSEDDIHVTSFWGDIQSSGASSGIDDVLGSEVLAAICSAADQDSDIGLWAADTEGERSQIDGSESTDPDTSRSSGVSRKPKLSKCVQCKQSNDTLFYSYCFKCYQARKRLFPPRPRRYRSREKKSSNSSSNSSTQPSTSIVEPEKLRKYLTNLTSGDSGLATSHETEASTSTEKLSVDLNLDKIIVPEELIDSEPLPSTSSSTSLSSAQSEAQKSSSCQTETKVNTDMLDEKELCIVCTTNPKNGIFVHGSFGHMCCCYKCAIKVWQRNKRCPACNCKVNNVLKVFLR